jgi:hypothetical protein
VTVTEKAPPEGEPKPAGLFRGIDFVIHGIETNCGFHVCLGWERGRMAMSCDIREPYRICASRGAKLHFHLGMNPETGEVAKEPDWKFTAFIRPKNLKRLGELPHAFCLPSVWSAGRI